MLEQVIAQDSSDGGPRTLSRPTARGRSADRCEQQGGLGWCGNPITAATDGGKPEAAARVDDDKAGATRVEFGIEWRGVQNFGVYRRVIADNGLGMTADELVAFFNTFGGGGKSIRGVHENFGVGAKTSLLPSTRYGMVVISWVDGEPSMIWVRQDESTGEYGLRVEDVEDETAATTLGPSVPPTPTTTTA